LQEKSFDLVSNLSEGFFNIDAKPFKPTGVKDKSNYMTGPLAISNFASTKGAQSKDQVLLDPAQQ
jgi:hypothetical protein